MKKRITAVALSLTLLFTFVPACYASGETSQPPQTTFNEEISPFWTGIASISPQFYIQSGVANAVLNLTPQKPTSIDYVKYSVSVRKSSGAIVKSWSTTAYKDSVGQFEFWETVKLPARGSYYMIADTKAYKSGKLIDTSHFESDVQTY